MFAEAAGLAVLFGVAFASGANDVGKSVATIVESSGAKSLRRALFWGGFFSAAGSITAFLIAEQLLSNFTSTLLSPTPAATFVLAALAGTAAWVLGATLLRLPVALTHAIVGSIIFLAAYLFGYSHLAWTPIIIRIFLPLLAGPFAALFLTYILHRLKKTQPPPSDQVVKPAGRFLVAAHWGSAAATSFARGINDAPKMVALGVILLPVALQTRSWLPYLFVAAAVFLGSIVWGDRVTQTLLGRLITLSHHRRVTAGFASAALVSVGAIFGEPLSTTHMTAGASAGMGGGRREHLQSTFMNFLIAWLVTLPAAGLLSIGIFLLLGKIPGF